MRAPGSAAFYDAACAAPSIAMNAADLVSGPRGSTTASKEMAATTPPPPRLTGDCWSDTVTDTGPNAGPDPAPARERGIIFEADYDQFGRPIAVRDPNGHADFDGDYNSGGSNSDVVRKVKVTQTAGPGTGDDLITTAKAWTPTGLPVGHRPNLSLTRLTYDGLGRLRRVFLPGNNQPLTGNPSMNTPTATTCATAPSTTLPSTNPPGSDPHYAHRPDQQPGLRHHLYVPRRLGPRGRNPDQAPHRRRQTHHHRHRLRQPRPDPGSRSTLLPPNPLPNDPEIANATPQDIPRYTLTGYDPASRPATSVDMSYDHAYPHRHHNPLGAVTVDNPDGPGRTNTHTDVWGRPTRVELVSHTAPTTPADAANYTYTPAGQLDTLTKTLTAGTPTGRPPPTPGTTTTTGQDAEPSHTPTPASRHPLRQGRQPHPHRDLPHPHQPRQPHRRDSDLPHRHQLRHPQPAVRALRHYRHHRPRRARHPRRDHRVRRTRGRPLVLRHRPRRQRPPRQNRHHQSRHHGGRTAGCTTQRHPLAADPPRHRLHPRGNPNGEAVTYPRG